ncbi:MAG: hypothetical protein FJX44_11480 [Alphaproteobacteria bacterium]|nr:hypothetical protein [Alphaproteobacteria bacterium]
MTKFPHRVSAARRNATTLLNQSMKQVSSVKQEQTREYEAMVLKTAKLRELRLAKEAADKEATSAQAEPRRTAVKPKRSRQT